MHNKRSRSGQRSFRPLSRVLAAQFKTAHASPPLVQALNDADELPDILRPLKFNRQLKTLSVTESGVTAVFDRDPLNGVHGRLDSVEIMREPLHGSARPVRGPLRAGRAIG